MIFYLWEGVKAHRFGFNGKENDNEVKGTGNSLDYGLRVYDSRLCRFLSVDPLTKDFPWYTPYQFAGNKPIAFIDLDGAEELFYKVVFDEKLGASVLGLEHKTESWGTHVYITYNNQTYYLGDPPPNWLKFLTGSTVTQESMVKQYAGKSKEWLDYTFGTMRTVKEMNADAKAKREADLTEIFQLAFAGAVAKRTIQSKANKQTVAANNGTTTGGKKEPAQQLPNPVILAKSEANACQVLSKLESANGAHFVSKHGAQTTLLQQYLRATTGRAPDGSMSRRLPDASRFFNNRDQLEAFQRAKLQYSRTPGGKQNVVFDMGKPIGEGFEAGGATYYQTTQVEARFDASGNMYTMFPKLK